ncbi:MAG: hypothetical protein ACI93R_003316 [Flavobacteriales bacterium]|jgi:hypothetical protein
MYILSHDGEQVGTTKLERGDPSMHEVSGVFHNVGGSKALAGWIKSVGGEEDGGVVFVVLNEDFTVVDQAGVEIKFQEASLISVPEDDEAFLDITGVSEEDYKTHFSGHISAVDTNG